MEVMEGLGNSPHLGVAGAKLMDPVVEEEVTYGVHLELYTGRVFICIAVLALLSAHNIPNDVHKYRKTILALFVFLTLSTIIAFIGLLLDMGEIEFFFYKWCQFSFITANISVCYHLKFLLPSAHTTHQTIISRIFVFSMIAILLCYIVKKYDIQFIYFSDAIVSIYTIWLLHNVTANINSIVNASPLAMGFISLMRLEVVICVLNIAVFVMNIDGVRNRILFAPKMPLYAMYCIKIYVVLTQICLPAPKPEAASQNESGFSYEFEMKHLLFRSDQVSDTRTVAVAEE